MKRYGHWTPGLVIETLQRWALDLGRTPKSIEGQARGAPVSCSVVASMFGSWSAGVGAAGLPAHRQQRPSVPPEVVAKTVELYRQTGSVAEVARRLGKHPSTISARLKKAGVAVSMGSPRRRGSICRECGEPLRRPTYEALCGFCVEEREVAA